MSKSWFRVTETAPAHILGRRMAAGDLLRVDPAEAARAVALGHLVPTTPEAECRPLVGVSEAERAALPTLIPEGPGRAEYAEGRMLTAEGTAVPMELVPMPDDALAELVAEADAAPAAPEA